MPTTPGTLRDVAEQANVSVATVSYVLSGKGRMTVQTRRRVERLLRDSGLRPRYKRYPVFYLSDHRNFQDMHAFKPFLDLYEGLNRGLHHQKVNLRAEFLHAPDAGTLQSQCEQLLAYTPGALVIDSNLQDDLATVATFFEEHGVPIVQVGHVHRAAGVDAVIVDNFGGAYSATRHLASIGHTRIATIRWNVANDPASAKKFAGFTCAMGEAGLPVRPDYIVNSPHTKKGDQLPGRVAIAQLLKLPDPPTAVFVENSFISPSLLYPSLPGETAVPSAIAAIDFVHFEAWHLEWLEQVMAGKLGFPARKTKLVRVDWQALGHMAAQRVVSRMEGSEAAGDVVQVVPRLFEVNGSQYQPL